MKQWPFKDFNFDSLYPHEKNTVLKKLGFSYLEHCHPDHPGAVEEFPELLFPPPQLSFYRFSCFPESHQMHPITRSSHFFKNYVLRIYEKCSRNFDCFLFKVFINS